MPGLLTIGTNRGRSMSGIGIGIGISEFRLRSLAFSPASVPGLIRWFDASDVSTLYQSNGGSLATSDGDPVGYWLDKSGNGGHASQGSGTSKPALKLAVKNSLNVLRFDGVNDYLDFPSVTPYPATIFAVFQHSSPSSYSAILGCNPYGDPYSGVLYYGVDQKVYAYHTRASATTVAASTFFIFAVDSTTAIYRNGAANGTGSTPTGASGLTEIGAVQGGALPFKGDIAELLIYNSVLDSTSRNQIFTALNSKWAAY